MSDKMPADILKLTAEIVSAHVANNELTTEALPALIKSVYNSLATAGHVATAPEAQAPAVPVRKSVFPEYIVCLEDGKRMKMLKRHLKTSYNMSPDEYPYEMGAAARLPDGGAHLRRASVYAGQENRLGKQACW